VWLPPSGGRLRPDLWSTPTNVSELNTDSIDQAPHVSVDRETLYFTSNRAGSNDLYKATRIKRRGRR
jgi:Tol biopolymer transport system component